MRHSKYYGAALAAVFLVPGLTPALAQSLTGNVGSAGVTDGKQAVEARIGFDDEGNIGSRVHYDYSFTDKYQLRLFASFSQPEDGDWDFSSFTIENWFQWSEEASDNSGFNGGLRGAYSFADGDGTDEAEIRLTITDKFAGDWEWRTNVIAEIEAGDGSEGGVELQTRLQLSRAIDFSAFNSKRWRVGADLFSEYGNSRDFLGLEEQAHQIGPVLKMSWDNGIYVQTALRVGLTDGSDDGMFKFFIGREF